MVAAENYVEVEVSVLSWNKSFLMGRVLSFIARLCSGLSAVLYVLLLRLSGSRYFVTWRWIGLFFFFCNRCLRLRL